MFRSWLFAPANHPRRVEKALSLPADVVVLDLEDACPVAEKAAAREATREALRRPRKGRGYVRINALDTPFGEADLQALVGAELDGVILPKASSPREVAACDELIRRLERFRDLPKGRIALVPLIETAAGVADIRSIARTSARVRRLAFGAVDLAMDLGMQPGPEETELLAYRSALVLAARVEGLEAPIDSVFVDVRDPEGFGQALARARALGFQGKLCIHPDQIEATNAAFAPTSEELARARRIVDAFMDAEARGSAAIEVDGALVDYPVARRAAALLASAAGEPS